MNERIQKVLARAGLGSRREIESWIEQGRITVSGRPAKLGDKITGHEKVVLNGKLLKLDFAPPKRRVLVYHKPVGEVCTRSDPEGRPTVFEKLPHLRSGRWIAIGRLDLNTAGLMLFTTDGELAHRLMHPSTEIEREYAVRVLGEMDNEVVQKLTSGVTLEDGPARFEQVIDAGGTGVNRWFHVILKEGRKREVRRLLESQGLTVSRLIRIRFGPVNLDRRIRPGRWEEMSHDAINTVLRLAGMQLEEKKERIKKRRNIKPKRTASKR
jgi:23S rRNA pseudouridine2605 synthase